MRGARALINTDVALSGVEWPVERNSLWDPGKRTVNGINFVYKILTDASRCT